jgi:hypothetical protein
VLMMDWVGHVYSLTRRSSSKATLMAVRVHSGRLWSVAMLAMRALVAGWRGGGWPGSG